MADADDMNEYLARKSARAVANAQAQSSGAWLLVTGAKPAAGAATAGPGPRGERVMMVMRKFLVRKNERGLLLRRGDFEAILEPGEHTFFLYRERQFGLRAAVGTRSLDELLDDKRAIDQNVLEHVRAKTDGFGVEVGLRWVGRHSRRPREDAALSGCRGRREKRRSRDEQATCRSSSGSI